jgi:hypothetical protein
MSNTCNHGRFAWVNVYKFVLDWCIFHCDNLPVTTDCQTDNRVHSAIRLCQVNKWCVQCDCSWTHQQRLTCCLYDIYCRYLLPRNLCNMQTKVNMPIAVYTIAGVHPDSICAYLDTFLDIYVVDHRRPNIVQHHHTRRSRTIQLRLHIDTPCSLK